MIHVYTALCTKQYLGPSLLIMIQLVCSYFLVYLYEFWKQYASFEVFTADKIQIEVFWVVTPCGVVNRHSTRLNNREDLDF